MTTQSRALFEPVASHKGTVPCKHWPIFDLYNYNCNSASYLNSFGLDDMKEADVTIVGLYIADDIPSQNKATRHGDLKKTLDVMEIADHGSKKKGAKRKIKANVVAINYYSPKSCAEKKCQSNAPNDWYGYWFGFDEMDDCFDTIGGCSTGYFGGAMDSALKEENWQSALAMKVPPFMPILQDIDYLNVWDSFGGMSGDLFVYDRNGRLYAYLCTNSDVCNHPIPGNTIAVQSGFDYAIEVSKQAATSTDTRCDTYGTTDDLPPGWASTASQKVGDARRSTVPEQDDDWVDGYSKSAKAAEKSTGTGAIGNVHPSNNKNKNKDYSNNVQRGGGPTLQNRDGVIDSSSKAAIKREPRRVAGHWFTAMLFLIACYLFYRYRRYRKMHGDAAGSYNSIYSTLPNTEDGTPGTNPSKGVKATTGAKYGVMDGVHDEERATLL